MAEAFSPFILFPADRQRAQADPSCPGVQDPFFVQQRHLHGIERLPAVAGRPPELRIFNRQNAVRPLRGNRPAVRCFYGNGNPDCPVRNPVCAGLHLQGDPARFMVLADIHIPQPCLVHACQPDIPPDPGIRQVGTPVPAEHAMRFSQIRKAPHRIRGSLQRLLFIGLPDIFRGRSQSDPDAVGSFLQQRLHIKFPGPVHVIRFPGRLPIDINRRQRIQSVAAKNHSVAVQQFRRNVKITAVDKIIFHDLQRFILIVPVKRILN